MKQNEQNEQNEAVRKQETTTTPKTETIDVSTLTADNLKEYLPALLMSLQTINTILLIILAAGIEAGR